jgi:hypothetical protein
MDGPIGRGQCLVKDQSHGHGLLYVGTHQMGTFVGWIGHVVVDGGTRSYQLDAVWGWRAVLDCLDGVLGVESDMLTHTITLVYVEIRL